MKSNLIPQLTTLNLPHRLVVLLCVCGLVFLATPLALASSTVTSLDDSGPGSLRQAIADAAPGDTIDFAVTGTITLTSGELVITNDLTIAGPGPTNLTVSGNNASRVFLITEGVVGLSGLSIANGRLVAPPTYQHGAGIYNLGTLALSNCWVIGNTNTTIERGGGLQNEGELTIIDSTISRNLGSTGGGIANTGSGRATIINSTISYNTATVLYGGGIANDGLATISATNTTFSGNTAARSGGGIADFYGCVLESCTISSNAGGVSGNYNGGGIYGNPSIHNTIVAGNMAPHAPDITGCHSLDYNLIGNTSGATITGVTTHNIYGKDPLLGPLADNGGPTPTHALLPGSPAIDQGSSGGLTTDQRGLPRSFNFPAYFNADDGSDIGAVEMQEGPQPGPVFTVNTTDDVDDGVPGIAHCSLREAIAAANANADTNTIDFSVAVPGRHTGVTGAITLTSGQLTITSSVNMNGPGAANLTVSGNNMNRIFTVTNGTVTITGLTVANGTGFDNPGGGIRNSGVLTLSHCVIRACGVGASEGGGIQNSDSGTLTLLSTVISNNSAEYAGGIYNAGVLIARNCTISSNLAAFAGGIANVGAAGRAILINCTVSSNIVVPIFNGYGGGILSVAVLALTNCTVSSNYSGGSGGGIAVGNAAAVTSLRNTIVAGNSAPAGSDCVTLSGAIISSLDYNLIGSTNGATITGETGHNIYNQDPKLGPLADLGGPTPTHALRFDSPALDAGHSGGLTTDQRGLPRPIDDPNLANPEGGDGSDIGAYEADPNLRMADISFASQDAWIGFNSMVGRFYRLECAENLGGPWSIMAVGMAGSGGSLQISDPAARSLPRRFYRAALADSMFGHDFDGGNLGGWTAFDTTLAVTNGALELKSTAWGNDARAVAGDPAWTDYCYEIDFMIADNPEGSSWPGSILFRVTEISSGLDVGKYYQVSLGPNRVGFERIDNSGGFAEWLAVTGDVTIPTQAWNHLRLVVRGNQASVWINGVLVLSYSGFDAYPTGRVGVKAINEGRMRFDNAKVWGL